VPVHECMLDRPNSNTLTGLLERLLRAGAPVNLVSKAPLQAGLTPLHCAVMETDADKVDLLLRHGADVNVPRGADGNTALHLACQHGESEAVKRIVGLLLARNPDMTVQNNRLQTPFQIPNVAKNKHRSAVYHMMQVHFRGQADGSVTDETVTAAAATAVHNPDRISTQGPERETRKGASKDKGKGADATCSGKKQPCVAYRGMKQGQRIELMIQNFVASDVALNPQQTAAAREKQPQAAQAPHELRSPKYAHTVTYRYPQASSGGAGSAETLTGHVAEISPQATRTRADDDAHAHDVDDDVTVQQAVLGDEGEACMHMCICVCVCVYVCIYIYIYIYIYTHTHIGIS